MRMDKKDFPASMDQPRSNDGVVDSVCCKHRMDCVMWALGIIFFGALMGAVFGLGMYREWDAPSGYFHNATLTTSLRFLPEPMLHNDPYPDVPRRSVPKAASKWYYWKNKPADVTIWTRLFAWLAYAVHQMSIWVVIYIAQADKNQNGGPRSSTQLSKYNWISFGINVFFNLLHLLQTHTTYDTLAQDTTVSSSQCAMIMVLIMILLMEYNERGLFLGWPVASQHKDKFSKKVILNMKVIYMIRKYHGYAFSWAVVFTFWYHPMENTYGHAMGFAHVWILMLQGSLMFTKAHLNHWWRLLLEVWVLFHGSLVALQTGEPGNLAGALWPMFLFGFLFMFCFSQVYILPFWKKIHQAVRIVPPLIYIALAVGAYSAIPDRQGRYWARMQEIIRIPLINYISFILLFIVMYVCIKIDKIIYQNKSKDPGTTRKTLNIIFGMLTFVIFVAVNIVMEVIPNSLSMFVNLAWLTIFFSLGSGVVCILMSHAIPKFKVKATSDRKAMDTWKKSCDSPNVDHMSETVSPVVLVNDVIIMDNTKF